MTTVVKRTVGFARDFEFVAEATEQTARGLVTVRAESHTPNGAAQRASLTLKERLVFAGYKRVVGFVTGFCEEMAAGNQMKVGFV